MTSTLLDHLRSTFTTTATNELARALGENPTNTQKALDGLIPAITSGVINRADSDEGAATLYHLLKSTPFDTDPSPTTLVTTDSHRQKAAESGNALLKQLYDERVNRLSESTAQYSGIGMGSATTLTGLVMSILMGFLHKQVSTRNLTQAQVASLLRGESETVRGAVPAALAGLIGWFIGTGTVTSRPVTTTTTVRPEPVMRPVVVEKDDRAAGLPAWLKWLLIAAGLLLLLLLLLRTCNRDKTATTTTTSTTTEKGTSAVGAGDTVASDLNGNEMAAGADSMNTGADANGPEVRVAVDLPGGRKLNVAENSFNFSLAKFLATKGSQAPKVFTFDNLTFDTNSARITERARPNVDDLIQIMQAYPSLNIRIEGNTDSTGDDATNDPLSAERAQAVKDALVKAGIQASRVTTRELGDTKPVASNKTEEGRQKNRRIDVVVTKL